MAAHLPLFAVTVMLLFTGCGEPTRPAAPAPAPGAAKPAVQPITPPAAPPGVSAVPAPGPAQLPPDTHFTYKVEGRRDPFAPIIVREEKKDKSIGLPPLERYPLNEFKLSGIVWGGFGYNAIMEGPDGKGYFVRVGTIVGQNRGVIRKIAKDAVIVEEKFKNYMGQTERKEIVISLRKKQEGMP